MVARRDPDRLRWGRRDHRENGSDVFSIRVDGTDRVNLTTAIAEQVIDLAWSPDGARLAVLCLVPGGTIRVYAVNADGSNPILFAEQRPASPVYVAWSGLAWSPTGERLAFVTAGESVNDLIVVGADGNGLINLTDDRALNIDPAWSPDGAQLAFVSGSRTRSHLEVIVADGTARRQLTATTGSYRHPSWSPDGSRIAVAVYSSHEDDANAGIYSIRADGADVIRITEDGDDPRWSPDGAQIAFVSAGVNVVAADGRSRTRLTRTDLFESDPQWSPDGALIAFSRHGPWD